MVKYYYFYGSVLYILHTKNVLFVFFVFDTDKMTIPKCLICALHILQGKCEDLDEEDTDVDEEGKPRLGDTARVCVNIRETVEFKVCINTECYYNVMKLKNNFSSFTKSELCQRNKHRI